ncbi:hypothetical protein EDC01DRAFT_260188 [Geopyxis carbonaria]|nr:hypothetical protein EDC01DRAFT_260188 [Geopyxis carbonaria]
MQATGTGPSAYSTHSEQRHSPDCRTGYYKTRGDFPGVTSQPRSVSCETAAAHVQPVGKYQSTYLCDTDVAPTGDGYQRPIQRGVCAQPHRTSLGAAAGTQPIGTAVAPPASSIGKFRLPPASDEQPASLNSNSAAGGVVRWCRGRRGPPHPRRCRESRVATGLVLGSCWPMAGHTLAPARAAQRRPGNRPAPTRPKAVDRRGWTSVESGRPGGGVGGLVVGGWWLATRRRGACWKRRLQAAAVRAAFGAPGWALVLRDDVRLCREKKIGASTGEGRRGTDGESTDGRQGVKREVAQEAPPGGLGWALAAWGGRRVRGGASRAGEAA